jgi:uncharacterized protein
MASSKYQHEWNDKIMRANEKITLAMDRSMRTVDGNGHLLVERTVISKASINPYKGSEIPDSVNLGLDQDKIYYLLRDKQELQKAVDNGTFDGIQLLKRHVPVSADEPETDSIVGTVYDVALDGDNVMGSLRVTDQKAIDLIESKKMQELSSGYAYEADMTSGTHNGEQYDGIMRNIHGNHVAIVERGRIGRDAIIADEDTIVSDLKLKKGALSRIKEKHGLDPETLRKAKLALDEESEEEKKAEDEEEEKKSKAEDEDEKKAEDEDDVDPEEVAEDEDPEPKVEITKKAMDSAIVSAVLQTKREMRALSEAEDIVKPIVGKISVAMDSAEDVYKYALDHIGEDVKGVHKSAYKALVKSHLKHATSQPKQIAQDSYFDEEPSGKLARIKRG